MFWSPASFRLGRFSLSLVLMLIFELTLIGCMVADTLLPGRCRQKTQMVDSDWIVVLEIELAA